MGFNFTELFKALWRSKRPRPFTPTPAVAPPITHKVVTKWTPISHNVELRKTCGFVPPTQGYAPCTREPHSEGPCAHPLLKQDAHFLESRMFQQEEIARVFNVPLHMLDTKENFAHTDALAQQLHREYRATSKALKGTAKHDHGWKHCRAKRYFWNRARQWRRNNVANAAVKP